MGNVVVGVKEMGQWPESEDYYEDEYYCRVCEVYFNVGREGLREVEFCPFCGGEDFRSFEKVLSE